MAKNTIDFKIAFENMPGCSVLLDIDTPYFTILGATREYLQSTGKKLEAIAGRGLFEVFPPSPDDTEQMASKIMIESFTKVIDTVACDVLPKHRCDIIEANGAYAEHYWHATNRPVLDKNGAVIAIIHTAENISERINKAPQKTKIKGIKQAHKLFRQAPVAIGIIKGPNLIIELANDTIIDIWGKGPDIIGKSITEVLPEVKDLGYFEAMHEVMQTGKPFYAYENPVKLIRAEIEETIYFTFFYEAYYENEGEAPTGVMIFAVNVTESVLALKKIKETELQYQNQLLDKKALLEAHNAASLDGILVVDAKGKILSFNKRFIGIWNIPQQIMDDKDDAAALNFAMYQLKRPEQFISQIKHCYENPDAPRIDELEFLNGSIIERQGYPVVSEDGITYAWSWSYKDVTKQRRDALTIRESADNYRDLAESLEQKVKDRTDTLQHLNETFQHAEQTGNFGSYRYNFQNQKFTYSDNLYRLLGCDPQEFPACPEAFIKYILPEDQDYVSKATSDAIDNVEVSKYEYRVVRKNGEIINVRGTGNIINDSNGDKYMIGTLQDITDEKKQQQQLKENNDMLVNMNKELESFAYISSHDLQEPLRKIQTYASRIIEDEYHRMSDTGQDHFKRIQNAAFRMQALIDDLLVYSRTNTEDRKFEKVDLIAIISEVEEDLSEDIKLYQATIVKGKSHQARIIPFQFRQLMHNIIGNALKFSQRSVRPRIEITIALKKGAQLKLPSLIQNEKYCHIQVADNGIGFEPQYGPKIFEVFQRLHTRDKYSGTGIGLAIVKKIVENHNGMITATGKVNEGATFDIYIPVGL